MNFNARLSRLRKYIQSKSLSSALIFNAPDVFYLTGATGGGVLLVGMDYLKIYMPGTIFEENKKIVRDEVDCVMFQDVLPWYEIKKTLNNKKNCCRYKYQL
ncbi:MAG: aminopeptidase P family N-terminal domain-containing protein [Elusimicrobiota bacterium]